MISSEEFSSAMRGVWRLLNRDTGGYDDFNLSVEGLKHSFTAVLIVAPIYLFITGTSRALSTSQEAASYVSELLALLFEWALFVALAVIVLRALGLATRLIPFLIAYNWSSVLIVFAMVPPALLFRYGVFDTNGLVAASIVVMLIALYFRWFIARTALETNGGFAALIVAGDLAVSLFAESLIR